MEPARSRIELFDMVWWMYFRKLEPCSALARGLASPRWPLMLTSPRLT